MRPTRILLFLLLAASLATALAACDGYPRDPDGTLERVRGGVMRVGVVDDPPFVRALGRSEPAGPEADLMRGYARSLGARIAWRHGGHTMLMRELEARRLEAVIGAHAVDSPWAERVATSRPVRLPDADGHPVERVLALPPGENAWLAAFERHAHAQAPAP